MSDCEMEFDWLWVDLELFDYKLVMDVLLEIYGGCWTMDWKEIDWWMPDCGLKRECWLYSKRMFDGILKECWLYTERMFDGILKGTCWLLTIKRKFVWNYWLRCMRALLILSTLHDK